MKTQRPTKPKEGVQGQAQYRTAMTEYLKSYGMNIHPDDTHLISSRAYETLATILEKVTKNQNTQTKTLLNTIKHKNSQTK